MTIYDNAERPERAILLGVDTDANGELDASAAESLDELEQLAETAGAAAVSKVLQNREAAHPGTYIGKGKIEEVKAIAARTEADLVICDDELTPAQAANLSDALDMKVLDRTALILDIFAKHAVTNEGKIQVELAQLKYRATRLTGKGTSLSRLGGGIGTRGPGENKLETDRRAIRTRISILNRQLEEVKQSRKTSRKMRDNSGIPVFALVGYTNTGKSTLLNRLTGAGVLEEDKLFATLDPTTRSLKLPSGQQVLLTDTVGFIRKLPHHLVDAFRSTLEEAKYADVILHVADASSDHVYLQMATVYATLEELGVGDKPVITVMNKQDLLELTTIVKDHRADRTVRISAKTGEGLDQLLTVMEEVLREQKIWVEHTFAYEDAGKIQTIRRYGQLLSEVYTEGGIEVKAYVPKNVYEMLFLNVDR